MASCYFCSLYTDLRFSLKRSHNGFWRWCAIFSEPKIQGTLQHGVWKFKKWSTRVRSRVQLQKGQRRPQKVVLTKSQHKKSHRQSWWMSRWFLTRVSPNRAVKFTRSRIRPWDSTFRWAGEPCSNRWIILQAQTTQLKFYVVSSLHSEIGVLFS